MTDYTKALQIQELQEQRINLLWLYQTTFACENFEACKDINRDILALDLQIKQLQNG